jgi:hypothetical protein
MAQLQSPAAVGGATMASSAPLGSADVGARTAGRHPASQAFIAGAPAGFGPACGRGAGPLGSEHDGSRPGPPGPQPGRRSASRHGQPPAWRPVGSGPSSRPPRHPPAAVPWHRGGRQARRPGRAAAGWSPPLWAAQAPPRDTVRAQQPGDSRGRWALTSKTSGASGRARTACSSSGPSRRASKVGRYGPPADPLLLTPASRRRRYVTAAPANPRSPTAPAP